MQLQVTNFSNGVLKWNVFDFLGQKLGQTRWYRITGKHKYQSLRTMAPTFVSNSQAVAIEAHFQYFSIYLPRFTPFSPLIVRFTKANSLIRQVGEQIFSHVRYNLKFLPIETVSETKLKPSFPACILLIPHLPFTGIQRFSLFPPISMYTCTGPTIDSNCHIIRISMIAKTIVLIS